MALMSVLLSAHPATVFAAASIVLPSLFFGIVFLGLSAYRKQVALLAPLVTLFSFIACFMAWIMLRREDVTHLQLSFHWFSLGSRSVEVGLLVDGYSGLMSMLITGVATLIQVYATAYLNYDKNRSHFFAYVHLFTAAMLGLAWADNLLSQFICWELVGLASYLLIGFWFRREEAVQAAKTAFLLNKLADSGFIIALMLVWFYCGSFAFDDLSSIASNPTAQLWAGIGILIAFMAKSAQFPLQMWLPSAMHGPTPASALIHAATMVVAGVFVAIRVMPLFAPLVLDLMLVMGSVSALLASLCALTQNDIKKILAFSTISHIGMMMAAIGAGSAQAAMQHLFVHGIFKAGLFLAAGNIIHAWLVAYRKLEKRGIYLHADVNNIRLMGGMKNDMPVTFACFSVLSLSSAGIPFFAGYLSKEYILSAVAAATDSPAARFSLLVLLVVSFLSSLYIIRVWVMVFWDTPRLNQMFPIIKDIKPDLHDGPVAFTMPITLLASLSVFIFVAVNPFNAQDTRILEALPAVVETEHPLWVPLLATLLSLSGILLGFMLYRPATTTHLRTLLKRTMPLQGIKRLLFRQLYIPDFFKSATYTVIHHVAAPVAHTEKQYTGPAWVFFGRSVLVLGHVVRTFDKYVVGAAVSCVVALLHMAATQVKPASQGHWQQYFAPAIATVFICAVAWLLLS